MGKNKAIIILGVGVVIAFVVSLLTHNYLQRSAQQQARAMETQAVVVAASDLTWGTVLTKDMLKTEAYLKKGLPEGAHQDPAKVEGRTLIFPAKVGEPIFESKLAPAGTQGGGVAAVIAPKKRAMAVKVDKIIGVSGFVHPGNRVDVLVTINDQVKVTVPITKTVLENVLVLAAGPEMDKSGKKEKPSNVDVITLEVTPEEGEKLALAGNEGKLQLSLRNSADSAEVITRGTTIPALLASYTNGQQTNPQKPVAKSTKPAAKPASPAFSVELIKGDKVSALKFEKGE
jgi:pilus assembly protein CpaB